MGFLITLNKPLPPEFKDENGNMFDMTHRCPRCSGEFWEECRQQALLHPERTARATEHHKKRDYRTPTRPALTLTGEQQARLQLQDSHLLLQLAHTGHIKKEQVNELALVSGFTETLRALVESKQINTASTDGKGTLKEDAPSTKDHGTELPPHATPGSFSKKGGKSKSDDMGSDTPASGISIGWPHVPWNTPYGGASSHHSWAPSDSSRAGRQATLMGSTSTNSMDRNSLQFS
ncbi:unnamed protein product [Amoebophrya sp. A25]|nr:unnamed protein product [Amoebophrya sp. A25]|eukprot:GSA25T00024578001.1